MANPQIHALVTKFAVELEALFQRQVSEGLQSALRSALGGAGATSKSPKAAALGSSRRAKPRAKSAGKRVRRSPAELAQDVSRLTAFVRANSGARSEKVRAALGLAKPAWIKALHQAVQSKQLFTKGAKRTTTLHVAKS